MNWDAIGAIGEIVGAIAVLATLIYLAIQIRQNSAIQRAQTHQQLALERVNRCAADYHKQGTSRRGG
jgi:hypothetical protein